MVGSHVFNLNGPCETIENGLSIIKKLKEYAPISCIGQSLPFPPDLDDLPLRNHIGEYPSISVEKGIENTFRAFQVLKAEGRCPPMPI